MTTIYQILGFAFFNTKSKEFKNYRLVREDTPEDILKEDLQSFLKMNVDGETEAYTLYKLFPETGKKHQLRKHLSLVLETPILGDKLHGYSDLHTRHLFQHTLKYDKHLERQILEKSIFLHANELKVPLESGKNREVKKTEKGVKRKKLELKTIRTKDSDSLKGSLCRNVPDKFGKILLGLGL
mmetsp:Transcript_31787/g.28150  ORF Transcript_31787/g.28150 Transcript_31787/m.28150 type:complete len:183 (-) Transcript_31787:32-580(-)